MANRTGTHPQMRTLHQIKLCAVEQPLDFLIYVILVFVRWVALQLRNVMDNVFRAKICFLGTLLLKRIE